MVPFTALFALGASIASGVIAIPNPRALTPRTHYAPAHINANWKHAGGAIASESIEFTFVLAGDYEGLTARMEKTASKRSAWLTRDELKTYVTPSNEAQAAVLAAIEELGATRVATSPAGDKVTVSTTVEKASQYLSADFRKYENRDGTVHKKTLAYTIPESLSAHVSDIYPISTFGSYRSFAHSVEPETIEPTNSDDLDERKVAATCSTSSVTSKCYRGLYGYSSYIPKKSNTTGPIVGILGYIEQNYSPTDLATWIRKYRIDAKGYSIAVNLSDSAVNTPSEPGVEAALDTQTIAGIIYPLPSTFYDIGNSNTPGDVFLLTFQNFIDTDTSLPPVISISYGADESEFTAAQAMTMCNAAQQLTALGTTIVASSGDTGVDGQGDATCPPFSPTYPGGCPYILSVGATQSFSPEVMVDKSLAGFYSGSGFSNVFPVPAYQSNVTAAYVASLNGTDSGFYNTTGRAFPDVSAQGSKQPVVASGRTEAVGGTSASAPIIAGGLGLLNNLLIEAGLPTTGWIHPTIYANPNAFTDVTGGGSYACPSNSSAGFPALPGWDAAAGLGTPLFAGLRKVYGV